MVIVKLPSVLAFEWDTGNEQKSWIKHKVSAAILRTFFERKGFTNEATNWLNVVIEFDCHFNR
jgi:hypothetical protein